MKTDYLKENGGYLPLRASYYVVLAITVLISVGAILFTGYAQIGLQQATAVADVDGMDYFANIVEGRQAGLLSVLKYAGLLMAALLMRGAIPAAERRLARLAGWLVAIACCLVVFWSAAHAFPGMSSLVGWGLVSLVVRCLAILSSAAEVGLLVLLGLGLRQIGGGRFKWGGLALSVLPLLTELSTAAWYVGPAYSSVLSAGIYLSVGFDVLLMLAFLSLFRSVGGREAVMARRFRGAALAACLSLLVAIGAVMAISTWLSEESLEGGELTEEEMLDGDFGDDADTYDPEAGYSDGTDLSGGDTPLDPDNLPEGDLSSER